MADIFWHEDVIFRITIYSLCIATIGIKQHNLLRFPLTKFQIKFKKNEIELGKSIYFIIVDVKTTSLTTYLHSAVEALHPPHSWVLNTFPHLLRYALLLPGQSTMATEKRIWKEQIGHSFNLLQFQRNTNCLMSLQKPFPVKH